MTVAFLGCIYRRFISMGKFKSLTITQAKELDQLIGVTDDILGTSTPIIKGNKKVATVVGTAIGGTAGAAITAGAGTLGVTGATAGLGGAAGFVGAGIVGVAILPVGIVGLLATGIAWLFGRNKSKKKEQQRQANYCKELAEKQQKIYQRYEELKKEHERTDKKKDDIINGQKEKIAEYEAIFEALRKKRSDLEANLSFI